MRYVVLGAGAVGATIGGRLHQAGRDVVLIARGPHDEALRSSGLLLRDPDAEARLDVAVASAPDEIAWRDDDVVVLATKVHQADVALTALAAAAPASVTVVCATNGLEAERLALRRFAGVVAMAVLLPAEHLEPGVVSAYSAPTTGLLDVGRYPTGVDDIVESIASDLTSSTFVSRADRDIMSRKHTKLLLNLTNVLDAACGAGEDTAELWRLARDEGVACYEAGNLTWVPEQDDADRRTEAGLRMRPVNGERRRGGSTWQSLARSTGDTEADYLNGEIVLLGRMLGVPTPVNAALQRLARELATSRTPPGSLTAADLRDRIRLPG